MPRPDFNESTFQLTYLHEYLMRTRAFDVYVPTLRSERQEGYDARVFLRNGVSRFFQFKVPFRKIAPRAWDFRNHLTVPYWRFRLHSALQHNILFDLASRGEHARYVASVIQGHRQLRDLARDHAVLANSRRINPIITHGRVTSRDHWIIFRGQRDTPTFHSDGVGTGSDGEDQDDLPENDEALADRPPATVTVDAILEVLSDAPNARMRRSASHALTALSDDRKYLEAGALLGSVGVTWLLVTARSRSTT